MPAAEKFPVLNFPQYPLRLKRDGQAVKIFDPIRKKWLVFTPEEWVRQHVVAHFIEAAQYPPSSISTEAGLMVVHQKKRTDVVVYQSGKAALLAECKAPHIKLTQEVVYQALNYDLSLGVNYIFITNGLQHFLFRLVRDKWEPEQQLPTYGQLL